MADNKVERDSILMQHTISAFVLTTLMLLIQIKYQRTNASPLDDTHIAIVVVVLILYAKASIAEDWLCARESVYHIVAGNIRLLVTAVGCVLLLLVLAPTMAWIFVGLWSCLLAKVTYDSFSLLGGATWVGDMGRRLFRTNSHFVTEEPIESTVPKCPETELDLV
ncbi:hypothetical protein Tsubulata_025132 [Turnera subulata]|uniref:Transmembrane protein n=1 Tax=Turnera subulata TaxID=218843 RepID=A0A9Q0J664_9ROSI|nr:hypothetical protein Tsubulata_025132 [Turnera subulata]